MDDTQLRLLFNTRGPQSYRLCSPFTLDGLEVIEKVSMEKVSMEKVYISELEAKCV